MTEPTQAYLAASAASAKQAAKIVLQSQQESMLKTIFNAAQLKQIDKWIAAGQADPAIDRPEAIRRLVELGLKAKGNRMFEVGKSYRITMSRDDRTPRVQEYAPCVVREVHMPIIKVWEMAGGEMIINTASTAFISAREATKD